MMLTLTPIIFDSHVAILPMLSALVAGVGSLILRRRPSAQKAVALLGGVAVFVSSLVVADAARSRTLVYRLGDWKPPFGIVLEIDALSGFMMAFSSFVMLVALIYSLDSIPAEGRRRSYYALWHFLGLGIMGAYSTGDIFNLFVWFEVLLMSSYILVVFYSNPDDTRAGLHYVIINLIGSAVMLLAIGGIYSSVGTLNMAHIAQRLSTGTHTPAVYGLSGILLTVFLLKAGAVPLHFWVPEVYPASPSPVAAVLAGVVKKVGVYAVIRLYVTVFAPLNDFFFPVILVVSLASVVYGGWAALSRDSLLDVLSYSSVAQVGFIFLGVSVGLSDAPADLRVLGVTAALVYSLNHSLIKSLLFLVAGYISDETGTTNFAELGGIFETNRVLSYSFLVGGLALIGIPPLSGFFGKLLVLDSGVSLTQYTDVVPVYVPVSVVGGALVGSILTVLYISRTWSSAFWGEKGDSVGTLGKPSLRIILPVVVLALSVLIAGIVFDPVLSYAQNAAHAAVDSQTYIDAALNGGVSK
ncbi:MAG: proton-conducting transporter membrane subunit [Halobacteria archaeon]|nr:proton-conducting transporter membrane subunit [Halobacteria archaeon]